MKRITLFCLGLVALDIPLQNRPAAAQSVVTDSDAPLVELSPPTRPGRRGGVYVTGSTNPFSLGLTNATGGTGGSYSSSTGAYTNTGASSGRLSSILVTNSNGLVSTNYVSNAVAQPSEKVAQPVGWPPRPSQIGSDPPVIISPVVPGTVRTINPNTGRSVSPGTVTGNPAIGNATIGAQGTDVVAPPPPGFAPQGTISAPPAQITPAAGPPAGAPRGTPSTPPPLAPPLPR
jgi:hypothetical protein